jgi:hypothetical protein
MFNVFIYDGQKEIPDDDILYIVGKDGVYLRKRLGLMESTTKVSGISHLAEVPRTAKMNLPMIPADKFATTVKFFKEVYKLYRSESMVLIQYDPETKLFILVPPSQEVSSASIEYDRNLNIEGYLKVGTIHSHADFSAFHSGVDVADEKHFDGLHITVGHVNQDEVSISASIVANQERFKVHPLDCIAGISQTADKVEVKSTYVSPAKVYVYQNGRLVPKQPDPPKKDETPKYREEFRFKLTTSEKDIQFNERWLGLVKKKTYQYANYNYGWYSGGSWHSGAKTDVGHPKHAYDPIVPIGMDEGADGLFDWYYSRVGRRLQPSQAKAIPPPNSSGEKTPPLNVGPASHKTDIPDPKDSLDPKAADVGGDFICADCIHRDEAYRYIIAREGTEDINDLAYDDYMCSDCAFKDTAYHFIVSLLEDKVTEDEIEASVSEYGGQDLYEHEDAFDYSSPEDYVADQFESDDFLTVSDEYNDYAIERSAVERNEVKNPSTDMEVPQIIEEKTKLGNMLRKKFVPGLQRFLKKH